IVAEKQTRSMIPVTTSFIGGAQVAEARSILRQNGIASFETPEEAVRGLSLLLKEDEDIAAEDDATGDDRAAAARQLLKGRTGLLSEEIAAELFALYDLVVPEQAVATSGPEAQSIAESIGYPVIAKVSSPDIIHKTDVGGVRVNLKTPNDVKKAYDEIVKACTKNVPGAAIRGVLLQQFLPIGNEFIVGGLNDPSFGPLVMAGLGGIYTELFKDTSFRLAPVGEKESYEMLASLKSWKLLSGMRGKGALDIDALSNVIRKISLMLSDCPRITEIDVNPVLVGNTGVVIADTKVVLG
nr:acetate--CoA ligase family protein [Candidatus Peribacteraceae bacterium]